MTRARKLIPYVFTIVIAVTLWQGFIQVTGVDEILIPTPWSTFNGLRELLVTPDTWEQIGYTVRAVLGGFVLGTMLACVIAYVFAKFEAVERAFKPLVIAFQVTPKVTLVPLFIVWFGFGVEAKTFISLILCFFPMFNSVLLGMKSIQESHRDVMRVFGASRTQTFLKLEVPSTLPYLFNGMEVGVVFALTGTIVGEFLAGNTGLGYLVVKNMNALATSDLFAVIIILMFLGFVLNGTVSTLGRLLTPWHESVRLTRGSLTGTRKPRTEDAETANRILAERL